MKKRIFLIPSLLAAGLFPQKAASAMPTMLVDRPDPKPTLFVAFRLDHKYTLAGHRSHSSHRSHRSHSSHRSSSGGGYSTRPYSSPAPLYRAPSSTPSPSLSAPLYSPPSAPAPVYQVPSGASSGQPAVGGATALPGNSNKFREIVMLVQTALLTYGYYDGVIDGLVGPQTRHALERMQSDYGLKVTGTITPETLDALRIEAR